MTGTGSNRRINGARLWDSLMAMAQIGPGVAGGNNRMALTDEDSAARHVLQKWCAAAGLEMGVDRMGNMFFTRAGTDPDALPVFIGSHLDTQPTGGKYDGVLGVLAGLEVMRSLNDDGISTKHPITLVNWTNEEGTRFAPGMMGSGVFAGVFSEADMYAATDHGGKSFGQELGRLGWQGAEETGARKLHAYFELHIEQGPLLERHHKPIGIVTHVQGLCWLEITFTGQEAHTGSTPMTGRRNAGLGLARLMQQVDEIAWGNQPDAVATVGEAYLHPNSCNVIPGKAVCKVDLRCTDRNKLHLMRGQIMAAARDIAAQAGLGCEMREIEYLDPVCFDAGLANSLREGAAQFGYDHMDIVSGAVHDACQMNRLAPTIMVMCPCVGGISHNEAEEISPEWAQAGADVLFYAVLKAAQGG